MSEKRVRLNQAARQYKVGLNTLVEFLHKKGFDVDHSPNTIVPEDALAALEKEFGGNTPDNVASVRERINFRPESVSLDDRKEMEKKNESDFREELVVKTGVISVKEEVASRGPKVLGKIDLDEGKSKNINKPEHKAEPKSDIQNEDRSGNAHDIKLPSSQHEKSDLGPAHDTEPQKELKTEHLHEEQSKPHGESVTDSLPKSEPESKSLNQLHPLHPQTVDKEEKPQPVKSDNTPSVVDPKSLSHDHVSAAPNRNPEKIEDAMDAKPAMADITRQTMTYDDREAADRSNVFRPDNEGTTLSGPKVLGKIDVKDFERSGKREKRKRITKDKIDVTKQQSGIPSAGRQGGNQGKPVGGKNSAADKKKGKKGAPKPILRPEVSDEEVQKQVKETLARLTSKGAKSKSAKYRRDKRDAVSARLNEEHEREEQEKSILQVTEFVTVSELATMMDVSVTDVITACMNLGLMVSINQRLDAEALVVVAEEFGFKVEFVSVEIQEAIVEEEDSPEELVARPPIVTVMGHVDHGKTSLLDNIRKTNVIAGEAGGITQHIGAYSVELDGRKITFLDTPGHEAFTAMRARGAAVTDVAIIIVAADDNVMPQTVEAINHASAAGVPIVFAINKIDKEGANPDHIKEQLAAMNYLVEDWGGKYQSQEVSAKKGINLDKLLEKVLLEAEFLDLKANPNKKATGVVIESSLDKGRGYVSTVLVQNGTLHLGDILLAGTHTGRVKAMFDENGKKVTVAPPSTPVLVLGLNGAPQAGDAFNVMDDDRSARELANKREQLQRMQGIRTQKHVTLDEIGRRIAIGNFKELNLIVKGDVDGSVEAMTDSLIKLSKEEVQVNVIHKAVGQISESDVILAAASNAVIVGFQVRPSAQARKLAEKEEIEMRLYSIIYDAINDIKDAIDGMLAPETKEEIVCSVEVLETFKISKVGTIAGCIVREGKITRNTPIRVIRDGIVVYTGKLGSLKRYKDDVKEVVSGMECGLNIENYNDIKVGDIVEGYEIVEVKR